MKLIVSRAAAVDLDRVHSFFAKKNPAAATRAAKILASAIQSLDTMPERGRPSGVPNIRELGLAGSKLYASSCSRLCAGCFTLRMMISSALSSIT
jgi:plasmid stabilization system protein ParE